MTVDCFFLNHELDLKPIKNIIESQRQRFEMECQQAAKEMCKQGWMNDACEPSLEELEVCLTQERRSEEKARTMEQHKAWVGKTLGRRSTSH